MCLICVELQKNKLSKPDLIKNMRELSLVDPKHAEEVRLTFKEHFEYDVDDLPLDFFFYSD
jgi:hypothetical protein